MAGKSARNVGLGLALLLAGCLPWVAGCSGETKAAAAPDGLELLELLEGQEVRYDPKTLVETELGSFQISRRSVNNEGVLIARFELFAVVSPQAKAKLTEELPLRDKRLRDAVISLVQRTDLDQLTDPSLTFLKSELTLEINQVLQGRLVKQVIFSNFSLEKDE